MTKLPNKARQKASIIPAIYCALPAARQGMFTCLRVELELIDRERRMVERRIKAAKFPSTKSLDSFDFKAMPSLNKMLVMELARCDYITRNENIIMPKACL
ncbi:IstB-like ATP binding protein [Sulfitobacter brevis]|uniref:IstB-like ATP binding protein n=1 Tax=Sulfitobacter brevis TaxID=74348 RepID=A0A1I2F832_9RHOB|nr:IstB-like ATP binding protein [Sulfitobacter brevis]